MVAVRVGRPFAAPKRNRKQSVRSDSSRSPPPRAQLPAPLTDLAHTPVRVSKKRIAIPHLPDLYKTCTAP